MKKRKSQRLFAALFTVAIMGAIPVNDAYAAQKYWWNNKMTGGSSIFYWVSADAQNRYGSSIKAAEREIEIPLKGYSNNMKMTQTSTKSS